MYSKYTKLISGKIDWKCFNKLCKAKLYTIHIDHVFLRESGVYSHVNIEINMLLDKLLATI